MLTGNPITAAMAGSFCAGVVQRGATAAQNNATTNQIITAALNPKSVAIDLTIGATIGVITKTLTTKPTPHVAARTGGVTDDAVRSAMRGAPLQTTQSGGVSLPKVQRYVDRLRAGEVPPPIKVDGTRIVDGNHRYIASRIAGVDIEVQPWTGSRRPVVDWDDLPIDPTDWGD